MRIVRLNIHGFGIYHDLSWDNFSPGLNVFEGPNEAGKSTLMAFIRAVLFGFADRRGSENRYELAGSRRYGGSLVFEDQKGLQYTVERFAGGASGKVTVHLPDRTVAGEAVLQNIWGGVSRTLYKNVFAFGLDELERLETLQNNEVSGYIYSAGMGTGSVSMVEVERKLKVRAEELYKSGGQKPKINNTLKKLEKIESEIQTLKEVPAEYSQLQKEKQSAEERLEQNRIKLSEVRRLIARAEKAIRGREFYEQLQQIGIELERLPEINNFPELGMERWERMDEKLTEQSSQLEDSQLRLSELRGQLEKLCFNEELLKLSLEIEVLGEERRGFVERYNSLSGLKQEVKSISEEADRSIKLLGYGWSSDRVRQFSCSVVVQEQVRTFKDNFRRYEERINEQLIRLTENERQADKCRLEKDAALLAVKECQTVKPPTTETWAVRENSLQKWQAGWARLEKSEQDLRHLADRRKDVQEQYDRLENGNKSTGKKMPEQLAFLLLIMFGLISILYFRDQLQVVTALPVFISVSLVLYIVLCQNRKVRNKQVNEELSLLLDKIEETDRQFLLLHGEIAKERRELSRLAAVFCGKDDPTSKEVFEAAKNLEEEKHSVYNREVLLKSLSAKEEEMRWLVELSDRYKDEMALLQEKLTGVRRDWNGFLGSLGFAQELSPNGLEELLLVMEKAQLALEQKDRTEQKFWQVEKEVAEYVRRVNHVLPFVFFMGKKETQDEIKSNDSQVKEENIAAVVLQIKDELTASRQARDSQMIVLEEISGINRYIENLQLRIEKLKQEQFKLLSAGGTDDPEEFRKRSVAQKDRKKLLSEKLEVQKNLRLIAGSQEKLAYLAEILQSQDDDEVRETLIKLQQEYDELEKSISDLADRKGRLAQMMADLEKSDELAGLMLSKESLLAELSELIHRWSVGCICQKLLVQAREGYERERQPAVLKRASGYFKTFTGGKYRRILVPLGENKPEVEKNDLTRLKTSELSRGTAEQLYLAMRFALVREFAERVVSLPVLMDDILVNFDPTRMQAAVAAIGELSRQHQVLFFTCHPNMAQMLVEVDSGAKYVRLGE